MDDITYRRMLPLFLDEARRQLETMDAALLELAISPGDGAARVLLQRAAHTLSGNAAAMELGELANDARSIEELSIVPLSPVTLAIVHGARAAIRRSLGELAREKVA